MPLPLLGIIASCRRILVDPSPGVTWQDDWFLDRANEAERAIVALKPDAFVVRGLVPMVAGVRQLLPDGATALLDLYENEDSGLRTTQVSRSLLQEAVRFWPSGTQETDVRSWSHDPLDPLRFEVFPANDGFGSVWGLYGAIPDAIPDVGANINLPAKFEQPIIDFIVAKAYSENTERQDLAKASGYDQKWQAFIGAMTASQIGVAPKVGQPKGQ